MIEEEEGESDQVEREDGDQVETNVDLSPGKIIQDVAVVSVTLLINKEYCLFLNTFFCRGNTYLGLGVIIKLLKIFD